MSGLSETLKPCPFCGGPAEVIHLEGGENDGGSCVSCTICFASSPVEFGFKENFISNWNRRSSPQEREAGEPVAWTGVTHDLKTRPEPFEAVADGLKPWELRRNDRGFSVGDRLVLRKWDPAASEYCGSKLTRLVTWILEGPAFGLPEGYVIMSLAPPNAQALEARVKVLEDTIDGLESELQSAVEVAFRRGAHEWVRLNYPAQFATLTQGSDNAG